MKKFILKTILLCLPLIFSVLLFIIIDPFMIVMDNRGKMKMTDEYCITTNRDFQSTELFLKNYPYENYDAFIFGNSRSFFYNINTWNAHIGGNGFHFNSSSESLFGIERKLNFLNKTEINIKNALIVLDFSTLSQTENSRGHLFIKHPITSGDSYREFYLAMFKGFFPKPMLPHSILYVTGKRKDYMAGFGIRENVWNLDLKTNQLTYDLFDSIISNDKVDYYKPIDHVFFKRDTIQKFSKAIIGSRQKELLINMNAVLTSHNTNFKIIINPLYKQVKLNSEDLSYLKELFGVNNVFDFSGQNKYTESKYNYYDVSHYRPHIADDIMRKIYSDSLNTQ